MTRSNDIDHQKGYFISCRSDDSMDKNYLYERNKHHERVVDGSI